MQQVACSPAATKYLRLGINICIDTLENIPLVWSIQEVHLGEICDVASFVRNLLTPSTSKGDYLYQRNMAKNDVTVRQNPVVTL